MPGGLRAKSIIFAFPFYERDTSTYNEEERTEKVLKLFSRMPFVRKVWVDPGRLREPLYIEVNPQSQLLQGKSIEQIEAGLEKFLARVYNFRQCL